MEALRSWQEQRRSGNIASVRQAIETLKERGETVNFRSVAALSGLTRKTLYAVPELKLLVLAQRKKEEPDTHAKIIAEQAARIHALEGELARIKGRLYALRATLK